DLRPALTTTMLKSTRTTSAVMSSPCRISCRVRDSSNSAAKFSIGAELLDAMLEMAVAMGVGSFINQAAVSENPFSRAAGGWSNPHRAPAEALGSGLSLQDYRHKGYRYSGCNPARPVVQRQGLPAFAPAGPAPNARYRSSTKRTAAAIVTPVVSRITASFAGASGATARS